MDASTASEQQSTLYVGNLEANFNESMLSDAFQKFGSVVSCKIIRDSRGINTPYGFVEFKTPNIALNALNQLNGSKLGGKEIKVNWAQKSTNHTPNFRERSGSSFLNTSITENRGPSLNECKEKFRKGSGGSLSSGDGYDVFVGGLGIETTESVLQSKFSRFGAVTEVRIMTEKLSGKKRGYGFVRFLKQNDAENAIREMNGSILGGKVLITNWAVRKNSLSQSISSSDAWSIPNLDGKPISDFSDANNLSMSLYSSFSEPPGPLTSADIEHETSSVLSTSLPSEEGKHLSGNLSHQGEMLFEESFIPFNSIGANHLNPTLSDFSPSLSLNFQDSLPSSSFFNSNNVLGISFQEDGTSFRGSQPITNYTYFSCPTIVVSVGQVSYHGMHSNQSNQFLYKPVLTDEYLRVVFRQFGDIMSIVLSPEDGSASITFFDTQSAEMAIYHQNGKPIEAHTPGSLNSIANNGSGPIYYFKCSWAKSGIRPTPLYDSESWSTIDNIMCCPE